MSAHSFAVASFHRTCRPGVRDRAQLLITNPDMLHMSILPVHGQFGRLMAGLKYVVVDEGHTYKGEACCVWLGLVP